MTMLELVMGCFVAFLIFTVGCWTFRDIAFFSIAAILMLFFFLLLIVRKKKGGYVFLLLANVFLIIVAVKLPVLFPLRTHIRGGRFHNESVATILKHISVQRQERPHWRFQVYDEKATKNPITVTITDDCTLQQALDSVAQAMQCNYDWYWHKFCGNEPTPICATFRFRRPETEITSLSDYYLFVDGNDVWQPESPK